MIPSQGERGSTVRARAELSEGVNFMASEKENSEEKREGTKEKEEKLTSPKGIRLSFLKKNGNSSYREVTKGGNLSCSQRHPNPTHRERGG